MAGEGLQGSLWAALSRNRSDVGQSALRPEVRGVRATQGPRALSRERRRLACIKRAAKEVERSEKRTRERRPKDLIGWIRSPLLAEDRLQAGRLRSQLSAFLFAFG